jgi:mannose/fructose/N-acetylgalactosamine-specific phosphotransferase system component IIC
MTKELSICCVLVALIVSLAVAYITMTTPFFGTTTSLVTKASAQETAEERDMRKIKMCKTDFHQ